MNFKTALDKYLTTPPEDGSENYIDEVWAIDEPLGMISDKDYDDNNDLLIDWTIKCFDKGLTPEKAGRIIYRAFIIYIKNNLEV